jgi:D-aspartate ligase
MKPTDKHQFHMGAGRRLAVAQDIGEAIRFGEELLQTSGKLIVQEKVDGPDDAIYFCLFYRGRGTETVAMYTGRKLASIPPGTGSTAFCEAAPADTCHILQALTRQMLERLDYSGFGSVEYKWGPHTQRFVIIEPTVGRTDWQEESATLFRYQYPTCRLPSRIGPCRGTIRFNPAADRLAGIVFQPADAGIRLCSTGCERLRRLLAS